MLIAVFGYLSLLKDTPDLFYLREKPPGADSDVLMLIGQGLVGVIVMIGFLCLVVPCRHNVTLILSRLMSVNKESTIYHLSVTSSLICLSFTMSVFVPGILSIMKFLGALSTVFCYVIPSLFEVRMRGIYKSVFYLIQAFVLTVVAFTSVVLSFN